MQRKAKTHQTVVTGQRKHSFLPEHILYDLRARQRPLPENVARKTNHS